MVENLFTWLQSKSYKPICKNMLVGRQLLSRTSKIYSLRTHFKMAIKLECLTCIFSRVQRDSLTNICRVITWDDE